MEPRRIRFDLEIYRHMDDMREMKRHLEDFLRKVESGEVVILYKEDLEEAINYAFEEGRKSALAEPEE
jgi:Uri superfamily endonuclease